LLLKGGAWYFEKLKTKLCLGLREIKQGIVAVISLTKLFDGEFTSVEVFWLSVSFKET
jgi:hypothetical protein